MYTVPLGPSDLKSADPENLIVGGVVLGESTSILDRDMDSEVVVKSMSEELVAVTTAAP